MLRDYSHDHPSRPLRKKKALTTDNADTHGCILGCQPAPAARGWCERLCRNIRVLSVIRGSLALRGSFTSPSGLLLAVFALLLATIAARADEPGTGSNSFDPAGIRGALVLCGGGRLPDEVRDEFVKLGGGSQARLVIIPTASGDDTARQDGAEVAEIWRARGIQSVAILHTCSQEEANDPEFVEPLKQATAVWITGGRQTQIVGAYSGTLVETELQEVLARGGVIGGTSAGAACQSRVVIVRGNIYPTPGLGLIPGAIIDQHFLARERKPRLLAALEQHPSLVGFGIDEGTALIIRGRSLKCLGDSTITICLGATNNTPVVEQILKPDGTSDLTMWRRAALARSEPRLTLTEPVVPETPHGSLVIVGGGRMPREISERFIELAGGPESLIVVLPTPNDGRLPLDADDRRFLDRAGAQNVRVLTAGKRHEVESPEFRDSLKQAKGIWFGGGRQWRFVDAYEGTQAIELFRDVLRRGGVIGGSSAGATIQAEYLVRGSPLGNQQMMCPGYERGFCFLPGTAIDQHFAQRKRFADMTQVVKTHPQLLGIGVDESTALVVQGRTAEVMGKGQVHFYNRRKAVTDGEPDYESVESGKRYNLVERKLIETE